MAKTIMVVDDDMEALGTVRQILEGEGHTVVTATNGVQALDALTSVYFDLILLDIRMPTLSGFDLLRLMKERLNREVKMIFVSIVPHRDVDTGDVDGFIQKPFSSSFLIQEINRVLGV